MGHDKVGHMWKRDRMVYSLLHGGGVGAEQRGEDSENFRNLCTLKCILMTEKCFIGGYRTIYFNESLYKIWSIQDGFLWKFMYKMFWLCAFLNMK